MRLLVDSHALIWYVDQDHLLSPVSRAAITDPSNDLLLSAGSIWEIGIQVGLGKLVLSRPYGLWMTQAIRILAFPCCRSPSSMPTCRRAFPDITAIRLTGCWLRRHWSNKFRSSAVILVSIA